MWFPRPSQKADLFLPTNTPSSFSKDDLYNLLLSSDAVERQDKVGVLSPADGSAKTTCRLLESGNYFLKTQLSERFSNPQALLAAINKKNSENNEWKIWHPQKRWFGLKHEGQWLLLSICPNLMTLRQVKDLSQRLHQWDKVLSFCFHVFKKFGIGLDLNPSNFGFETEEKQIYYLDDEVYSSQSIQDFSEFVAMRIPEESQLTEKICFEWGKSLKISLRPFLTSTNDWLEFLDGIRDYSLTKKFKKLQESLLRGIHTQNSFFQKPKRHKTKKRICILSDIHANLPALDSVLKEAKSHDVTDFLVLGDVVGYGPYPKECIQRIQELKNSICIRGNHDQMIAYEEENEDGINRLARESARWSRENLSEAELSWLKNLPLEYAEENWLAVHGAPIDKSRIYGYVYEMTYRDNLEHLEEQNLPLCFFGHTHIQITYRYNTEKKQMQNLIPSPIKVFAPNEILLINPGSVGQPRDRNPQAAYAIWDQESELCTFHRTSYPTEAVIQKILEADLPEELADRIEMGW